MSCVMEVADLKRLSILNYMLGETNGPIEEALGYFENYPSAKNMTENCFQISFPLREVFI